MARRKETLIAPPDDFRAAVEYLHSRGVCGDVDSGEYERLFRLWRDAGRPADVLEFIRFHATG
jgi:hypothetical protein